MALLYSRYVPAKPVQSQDEIQLESAGQDVNQQDTQSTEAESSHGRKKRKRNEKDESDRKAPKHARSKADRSEEGDEVRKSQDTNTTGEEEAIKSVKKSKKDKEGRKEKTEKTEKKEEQIQEAENAEDQERPGKHTAVLSKFQKAAERSAKIQEASAGAEDGDQEDEPQPELHDLTPFAQKQREPTPDYHPTFSAVPDWLAHPITVSQSTTKPFSELSLSSKTIAQLETKGWTEAFAVQAALLPLLLPHPYLTHLPPNDVCVSAPTGSGKTLGYVLPIIESLRNRAEIKLRAVIVVPTRELVLQAQDVASSCAAGSGLRIAVALGNQNLATEQQTLIKKGRKYDPQGYKHLMEKAKRRIRHEEDSDSEHMDNTAATAARNAVLSDIVQVLPDHVPTYTSAIDILICTPGRLVEHMNSTVGFNLDNVDWLVIDEADRLLDQSFQEWVAKVVGALDVTKLDPRKEIMDHAMPSSLQQRKDRYVRKVILSATMTRDIAKLSALRLRRPSLVQVKNEHQDEDMEGVKSTAMGGAEVYELPGTLAEFAVPVGDGLDKPLYLLQLLQTRILPEGVGASKKISSGDSSDSSDSDSDSDSESSDSDSSSDDSSADDDSGNTSGSDTDSDSSSETASSVSSESSSKPTTKSALTSSATETKTILIFTGSTEEAARLHHLLTALEPSYAPLTTLLTKSTASVPKAKKRSSGISIIISTDRASRGLDLASLTHVINYHMPRSVPTYVHRVGRTARAGRSGEAWTLFQENQGRWFWRDVARSEAGAEKISRGGHVERVNMKLGAAAEELRPRYVEVLGAMKDIVAQGEGRRKEKGKKDADGDVNM